MRYYRPLNEIRAITFDLDDTLYDNGPVIELTEQKLYQFLLQQHRVLHNWSVAQIDQFTQQVSKLRPEFEHDVTKRRWHAIALLLQQCGYSPLEANKGADEALVHFLYWRNKIVVPEEVHQLLRQLRHRFPLIAITNGNSDPRLYGISGYFDAILRAGPAGRAKPWPDMYLNAAHRLGISPSHLLHVGDDLTTDVAGAIRCGAQACWVNNRPSNVLTVDDILPHMEISRLVSLAALL
ncbi:MAG: 5-amino-6-(5-phospho-D-ribitylamino)uracil phosphatase YigB [Enterobacteriaceae bacterium]